MSEDVRERGGARTNVVNHGDHVHPLRILHISSMAHHFSGIVDWPSQSNRGPAEARMGSSSPEAWRTVHDIGKAQEDRDCHVGAVLNNSDARP